MMKDWTFKNNWIAENFDNHVREQLPWYDLATSAVVSITRNYLSRNGIIYDIGASTGNIGRATKFLIEQRGAKLIAIEESNEMAQKYDGGGLLQISDAVDFEYKEFSVAICFLSLMFISKKRRSELLQKLKASTEYGGCIIVVEKFESVQGYASTVFRRMTSEWKLKSGASPSDILDKELSLSGVQRPLDQSEVDGGIEFFRIGEFAGYIIEKQNPNEKSPNSAKE